MRRSLKQGLISIDRLKEMLSYDASTGVFTWIKTPCANQPEFIGRQAGDALSRYADGSARYVSIVIDQQRYAAHRLAWFYVHGRWPGSIDHINRDRRDNRLANLRECTHAQNMQNTGINKRNTSGFVGAQWNRQRQRWAATIVANGIRRHLGLFDTAKEAGAAYLAAKRKYHVFEGTARDLRRH